jgi:DNA topoisomerase VI subunit B
VRVFEGHAFLVEAAVSVGGRDMKPGLNIYRWGAARSWGLDVAPVETN